jgi:hypothetical protein
MLAAESNKLLGVTYPLPASAEFNRQREPVYAGTLYDRGQGEIFWSQSVDSLFNNYRDGVLQNESANTGSSFFQRDLVDGVSYQYVVGAVVDMGEVSLGGVLIPVN